MEEEGLLLTSAQWNSLLDYIPRIEQLFQVKVTAQSDENGGELSADTNSFRVRLVTANESRTLLENAKSYVESVVASGSEKHVCWEQQSSDSLKLLAKHIDSIERQSQAVLSVLDRERVICIWGTEHSVNQAKSLMAHILQNGWCEELQVITSSCADQSGTNQTGEESLQVPVLTLSPSLESNPDSCYDSDGSSESSRQCHKVDSDWHTDVTRTTSDTLDAELTDTDGGGSVQQVAHQNQLRDLQVKHQVNYEAKVELYLKLGFTEKQLKTVLHKLGSDACEDSILQELLTLGKDGGQHVAASNRASDAAAAATTEMLKLSPSMRDEETGLRPVVIDGSNVAMSHGNKQVFSCRGIELAVNWFRECGHEDITVFVPQWRKEASKFETPITGQEILMQLENDRILVFTPARRVNGKRVVCYDDRYIIKLASKNGGIVVSNDNYRDLINEDPEYKKVIEQRLLMYTFVNDRFMPPDDPLGRHGPSLETFLQREPRPPNCPYLNRCTFGNKCKYYHPERGQQPHRMVSDRLAESARINIKKRQLTQTSSAGVIEKSDQGRETTVKKTPLSKTKSTPAPKMSLTRTRSLRPTLTKTPSNAPEKSAEEKPYRETLQDTAQHHLSVSSEFENKSCRNCLTPPMMLKMEHKSLREIRSDPSRLQSGSSGGHLALAQKLSDECVQQDRVACQDTAFQQCFQQQQHLHNQPIGIPDVETMHAKLNRQFSLQGAHDPRLQSYYSGNAMGETSDHSHGHDAIISPSSCLSMQQQLGIDDFQQRLSLDHHVPVTRMASAPLSYNTRSAAQFPHNAQPPSIRRQNSSSDPQLNLIPGNEPHIPFIRPGLANHPSEMQAPKWSQGADSAPPNQIILPINSQHSQNVNQDERRKTPSHVKVAFHPVAYPLQPGTGGGMSMHVGNGEASLGLHQQALATYSMPASQMFIREPSNLTRQGTMHEMQPGMLPQQQQHHEPQQQNHHLNLHHHQHPQQLQPQIPMHIPSSKTRCFQSHPPPVSSQQQQQPDSDRYEVFPRQYVATHESHQPDNQQTLFTSHPQPLCPKPHDPREQVFTKLCAIFPREQVSQVMMQHPTVNDAQLLCSYLV